MPPDVPVEREITRLLHRWKEGDREALASLASLAYEELHAIAIGYLRRAQVRGIQLTNRRHFYTFAAQLMRMILIDHARQTRALKRPGSAERVPLHEEMAWIDASSDEMLALDVALNQ